MRDARFRAACLLLLASATGACRDASADAAFAGTVDTLAGGVIHVRNPATGMWREGEAWTPVEELRIGAEDGRGPQVFGRVGALEVDALGRIYVLEPQAKEIRVFGADGRHVRTVGREGAGPGELKDAVGLQWDRRGRLWTLDQGNGRFTVFDTTGAFVTSHRKDGGLFTFQWVGGITRAGELFAAGMRPRKERGADILLVRHDSAGVARDTFALPQHEGPSYRHETDRSSATASVPFAPDLVSAFGPDGRFWGGISDRYRLAHTTLQGDTLRIVEREWTAPPVSAEERSEAIEGLKWMVEQGARLDFSRIPARKPAFDRVFTDDADHLWVQANVVGARPGTTTLDVFDPEGRFLGPVTLPARMRAFTPVLVRGDLLYTVEMDEMEVPYVVRYRLQGRKR